MSFDPDRTYKGVVRKGAVVLGKDCDLPEGTAVEVRPARTLPGQPGEVLAATRASPQVEESAVDELMRRIEEGRRPVRFDSTLG